MESYTGACFPGCEVPEWFSHQDYGSVIETELARHRSENRIIGVALCAAVSFQDYRDQNSGFSVKCTCEFKNADGSFRRFSCMVGSSAEPGIEPRTIESDHVFVAYTSLLQIKKQSEAEDNVCSSTTASFAFEVIDGAGEMVKYKVLKCGFSMVYEPEGNDHDHVSWEVNSDGYSMVDDSIYDDESRSSAAQEADEISIDGQGSNDDEGQQEEEENSCIPFEDNGNANLETDYHSDQNMDGEVTPGISFVEALIEIQLECNFRAIEIVNGEATLEETPSMSLVAASTEIQQECNSGAIENINRDDESKLDETPSMQKPHVTPTRSGKIQVINGEEDTTCFSFLKCFIPCL